MSELKLQQARNLKYLIAKEGTSQKELAETIGVTEQAVSYWAKGHTAIRKSNVEKIRKLYPDYSVEYLRGETTFLNSEAEEDWQKWRTEQEQETRSRDLVKFVHKYCRCSVGVVEERDIEQWEKENEYLNYYEANGISFDEIELPIYKVTRNQTTLVLSRQQWSAFVEEVRSYIDMRLTQTLNRGYW